MENPIAVPSMNGGGTQYVEGPKVQTPPRPPRETFAAPDTAHVQVNVQPTGAGTVVVNGQDWSRQVREVHLAVRAAQTPKVVLVAAHDTDFTFEGPGVVQVQMDVPTPWRAHARQWVEHLDPAALQNAIAEGSMGVGIGQAVKDALLTRLGSEIDGG
jgi:hypothetical protein